MEKLTPTENNRLYRRDLVYITKASWVCNAQYLWGQETSVRIC